MPALSSYKQYSQIGYHQRSSISNGNNDEDKDDKDFMKSVLSYDYKTLVLYPSSSKDIQQDEPLFWPSTAIYARYGIKSTSFPKIDGDDPQNVNRLHNYQQEYWNKVWSNNKVFESQLSGLGVGLIVAQNKSLKKESDEQSKSKKENILLKSILPRDKLDHVASKSFDFGSGVSF